jgi:hypothetical protein
MHQRHLYILILFCLLGPLSTNRLSAQDIKSLKRTFLDMVYVPQQDRFYAINSVYDNPTKSMLYRINPYSATVEDSTQVGYFIHKLTVTDDGRFLYIAEQGSSIYRFDLATKKVVLTIKLTDTRPQDSVGVLLLTAVPQAPNSVVVIRNTYFNSNVVLLLENSTIVATSEANTDFRTIAFGKNPNILYAYDSYSSGESLTILQREGTRWQVIRRYGDFVGTFAGNIKVDDGFLYANGGPFRLKLVGDFPEKDGQWKPQLEPDAQTYNVRPLFQSDPVSNVVYALSSEYVGSTGYAYFLSAYSKTNYLLIKKAPLPKSVPFEYLRQIVQWGTGRLAGLDNKQIIFVRDCTPSVSTPLTIEQGLTANVCPDSSVILTASAGFSNYFWTTGDTGRTIKIPYPNSNGNSLTVAVSGATSAQGCLSPYSAPTTIQAQYSPAKPSIRTNNGLLTVCKGDSVLALASNQSPNNDFIWSNGAKGIGVFIKNSGAYTVKAVSTEGCMSPPSDPISITIRPDLSPARPLVAVIGDTALCAGESVTFSTNLGFSTYEWYNSSETTPSITVSPTIKTSYGVRVTTAAGCISAWSNPVTIYTYTTPIKPIITANQNCMATQIVADKYQWFWNSNTIQGATLQFNLAQQRGGYTVKAINGRCPSPLSDIVNY